MSGQVLKFGRIRSRVSEFGEFKLRGARITLYFQRLTAKLCVGSEHICRSARMVRITSVIIPSMVGLD